MRSTTLVQYLAFRLLVEVLSIATACKNGDIYRINGFGSGAELLDEGFAVRLVHAVSSCKILGLRTARVYIHLYMCQ